MPCMICKNPNTQAHHLLRAQFRGMGMKAGDNWTVPLCFYHHEALHRNGDETDFFEMHNWEYENVKNYASALWRESNG